MMKVNMLSSDEMKVVFFVYEWLIEMNSEGDVSELSSVEL